MITKRASNISNETAYSNARYGNKFYTNYVLPSALRRDNFCCVHCGANKKLDVHHKHDNLDKLYLYDLITLCRSCHKKEHKAVKLKGDLIGKIR